MKNLQVLIIDDDEIDVFILQTFIRKSKLSADPLTFSNAKQALDHVLKEGEAGDSKYLVFLDINMPVLDGWQFLDGVKNSSLADRVYVVIITSSTDTKDKTKGKDYEFVLRTLEKPISMSACEKIKTIPELKEFYNTL